jgi:hypothetical protein
MGYGTYFLIRHMLFPYYTMMCSTLTSDTSLLVRHNTVPLQSCGVLYIAAPHSLVVRISSYLAKVKRAVFNDVVKGTVVGSVGTIDCLRCERKQC